ncbi:zinc knuckle CX2CX4HX4C containing protein [Tanacetum coccineum]|uniref:Zinc knuckle CX2CX4HX4C containing protein n=1 Tax=Tanacetum coccineum TaxID=301880 RepID=A0ABQ5EGW9_9ASTR
MELGKRVTGASSRSSCYSKSRFFCLESFAFPDRSGDLGKLFVYSLTMLVKHFSYSLRVEFLFEHKVRKLILKLASDDPVRTAFSFFFSSVVPPWSWKRIQELFIAGSTKGVGLTTRVNGRYGGGNGVCNEGNVWGRDGAHGIVNGNVDTNTTQDDGHSPNIVADADLDIPLVSVEKISNRFANTLFGWECLGSDGTQAIVNGIVDTNTTQDDGHNPNVTPNLCFALILRENSQTKKVHLSELHNDEIVTCADLAIPLASVEEIRKVWNKSGPWLSRLIPIILNIWTPHSQLQKDEITMVLVWVKLHNVSIVAYLEKCLSLITTKLRRPIMLDAYTSNMCVKSWGRNNYARVLIECQSPRCDKCKIFDHNDDRCPKTVKVVEPTKATDDGFVELTKPKPNYYYRPLSKLANGNGEASTSHPKGISKQVPDPNGINEDDIFDVTNVQMKKDDDTFGSSNHDSDNEEVEEVFVEMAPPKKTFRKSSI